MKRLHSLIPRRKLVCGAILILIGAVSCNRNDAEISPGEVIKSVHMKVPVDNALRMEVSIVFK